MFNIHAKSLISRRKIYSKNNKNINKTKQSIRHKLKRNLGEKIKGRR